MPRQHREHGATRQQILTLLRRHHQLSAAELGTMLDIGAVGVRQHLAHLEREALVFVADVRRSVGRPCHLYQLTPQAEERFPNAFERLALDALAALETLGGDAALRTLFTVRQQRIAEQYHTAMPGTTREEQVALLAQVLTDHGYMCEWARDDDGTLTLTEYNCPLQCVARNYPQACAQELVFYERLLGTPLAREETLAAGGTCCRYRVRDC